MAKRRQRNAPREYPRTARLNELLREILGEEIERIDDDRLGLVSITGVEVDTELTLAKVWLSSFDTEMATVIEVLGEHRGQLRKAISSQARFRRTPDLVFKGDPAVQTGGRIEEILRTLEIVPDDGDSSGAAVDDARAAPEPDDS